MQGNHHIMKETLIASAIIFITNGMHKCIEVKFFIEVRIFGFSKLSPSKPIKYVCNDVKNMKT